SLPHWLQNRPELTRTARTGAYLCSAQAQIRATNQPMMVQPKSRFTRKMAVASGLSRAMIVGRKYSRTEKNRNNIMHTPSAGIRIKGKQKEPLAKAKYAGKPRLVRNLPAIAPQASEDPRPRTLTS